MSALQIGTYTCKQVGFYLNQFDFIISKLHCNCSVHADFSQLLC